MDKPNTPQETGNERPERKVSVGNLILVTREDRSWSVFFPNGSLLEGWGNPFRDKSFDAIRRDFAGDVGRRCSDWLRKQFEEHYEKLKKT